MDHTEYQYALLGLDNDQDPIAIRTTHTTPDGTKWDLVLEPQDKSLLGHWSYLGIASKSSDTDFYKHFTFDSDRVYWSKLQPEDMINIMKYSLNGEWDIWPNKIKSY